MTPDPVGVREALVAEAVKKWINQSFDPTGNNRLLYYRHLKVGTLSFDSAEPVELSRLLEGSSVSTNRLFPEAADQLDVARRCRAIRSKAQQGIEERGIQTLKIAYGMATWRVDDGKPKPNAPILLGTAVLTPSGRSGENHDIRLTEDWELNPSLVVALGSEAHINSSEVQAGIESILDGVHDFEGILDHVVDGASSINGFSISRKSILGNFSYLKLAQAQKLKEFQGDIAGHTLLSAIAGDESARDELREGVLDLSGESLDATPPADEFIVLDADGSQSYVINAAVRGQNMVVVGPPGTGKSQTIANMIATLSARGKKTLFVAEKRAAIEAVSKRLDSVGLGDLILDMHDGSAARKRVAENLGSALEQTKTSLAPETASLHRNLSTKRNALNRYEEALHESRQPWDISFFNAQIELLSCPDKSHQEFRFLPSELESLDKEVIQTARELLSEFLELDGLSVERGQGTWADSYESGTLESVESVAEAARTLTSTLTTLRLVVQAVKKSASATGYELVDSLASAVELEKSIDRVKAVYKTFDSSIYESDIETLLEDISPASSNVIVRLASRFASGRYRAGKRTVLQLLRDPKNTSDRELYRGLNDAVEVKELWNGSPPTTTALIKADFTELTEQLGRCRELVASVEKFACLADLEILKFSESAQLVENLNSERETLYRLPQLAMLRSNLDEIGIASFIGFIVGTSITSEQIVDALNFSWLSSIVEKTTIEDSRISGFSAGTHQKNVSQFQQLDREHIAIGSSRVKRRWAENVVKLRDENPDESSIVTKQARLKSRHMPTGDLISRTPNVLGALKPCWVMSPLVVAEKLPPGRNFDVVIFDEASQILPADAILSLLQADQAIVAGDPKQLPPTTFFSSTEEELEEEAKEDEIEEVDEETQAFDEAVEAGRDFALTSDMESILDVMMAVVPAPHGTRTLSWHYRSEDERLIAFSNAQPYLYDWQLTTFPGATGEEPVSHDSIEHSHDVVKVGSGAVGPLSSSSTEVTHVVDLILQHAEEFPKRSLGVIAFGITHANRIEETLRQARADRPDLDDFFREDVEDPFFVKNLERVQGDERDSILISVGYSKLPDGRMRYMFGPLNRLGGERRLNVAITRARKTCKIVSSFSATDMDPNRLKVNGTKMLKAYIEYADSGGNDLGTAAQTRPALNPFERDLQDSMHKRGINNIAQYGASGYWIDFAAMHPERAGEPVLAIEADGASYHSSYSARDRDRLRQENLERQGWEFHRIWSTEWFRHRETEIERLDISYRQAVSKRDESSFSAGGTDDPPDDAPDPARPSLTPSDRSGNPPLAGRSKIDDYSEREIRNLLSWLESDGLLRTKLELFDEARETLGFSRRGSRITARLEVTIEDHRANGPVRSNPPGYSATSSVVRTSRSASRINSSRPRGSTDRSDALQIRNILSRSFQQGRSVKITYTDAKSKKSSRTISIYGMNGSYVDVFDSKSREQRTFKISRIRSAVVTRESYSVGSYYRPSQWV